MKLDSFPAGFNALIVGGSRGIGHALVRALLRNPRCGSVTTSRRGQAPDDLQASAIDDCRLSIVTLDVTDEPSIEKAAASIRATGRPLHLLVCTVGVLHDAEGLSPERRLEDIRPENLLRSFQVNALGPMLVARHFAPLLSHGNRAVFASLSARVGSIGDNRLGGWYAYRASKAAQNQLMRTFSIEMARRAPQLTVLSLHPGTVDTGLSKPFQAGVVPEKLFDADRAAAQLLGVIDGATPTRTGRFLAWDGTEVPW